MRRRLMSRAAGCALLVMLAPGLALPGAAEQSGRRAFIEQHRCAFLSRIEATRADRSARKDRFVLVSLKAKPESYVQCIFTKHDRAMLCEAASGYYETPNHDPARGPDIDAIDRLGRLGFSTDGSKGNFRRDFSARSAREDEIIAETMLGALFEGYGATTESELEWSAPLAKPALLPDRCSVST